MVMLSIIVVDILCSFAFNSGSLPFNNFYSSIAIFLLQAPSTPRCQANVVTHQSDKAHSVEKYRECKYHFGKGKYGLSRGQNLPFMSVRSKI